jgi:hypothetical protein
MRKPWFRPKLYGYGFTPVSWEGWLTVAVFTAALVAAVGLIPRLIHDPLLGATAAAGAACLLTAVLFSVSLPRTDGELRWRWGRD